MRRWCFYIFGLCCFLFLAARPYGEIFYLEANAAEAAGLADSAWPCKGYNAKRTGQSPYLGAQTNTLKWSYTTDDLIYSSPALGTDGTVYFGGCDESDGEFFDKIYALDPNGNLKWSYDTDDVIDSSPAISADGTIYIGCYNGRLYAVNQTGLLKWSYQGEGRIYSSPVLDNEGTVYFGCESGKIYALNPNGTLKWSYTADGGVYSSPAISDDNVIYIGNEDGCLYALDQNGECKWKYQTDYFIIYSSPAIDVNGTVYIGSYDSKIYAINPDGTLKWRYTTGDSIESSPAIASDGTIYIGCIDSKIYAFNPDGTLKWSYTTEGYIESSPVIGSDGTIYIGCSDDKIYALGPEGNLKWSYTTGDDIGSSPAIGKDGTIYVGSCDYKLYAFGTSSEEPEDPNTPPDPPPTQDTTPPVIICPDTMLVSTTNYLTEVFYEAEVSDDKDANPQVMYYPESGSLFTIGITEVTVIAADKSGNSVTDTFLVAVIEQDPTPIGDTTAPVITCQDMIVLTTKELTKAFYEAEVTDDEDANPQVMYYPESGSLFTVGITEVAVIATDASGNSGTGTFLVTVIMDEGEYPPNQDTTAPVITCHDMTVLTTKELTQIFYEAEVTDDKDPNTRITYYPKSGTLFTVGETKVAVIATDASGNSITDTFLVTVVMDDPSDYNTGQSEDEFSEIFFPLKGGCFINSLNPSPKPLPKIVMLSHWLFYIPNTK